MSIFVRIVNEELEPYLVCREYEVGRRYIAGYVDTFVGKLLAEPAAGRGPGPAKMRVGYRADQHSR